VVVWQGMVMTPEETARAVCFWYTNYRGEKAWRVVIPVAIRFDATQWHPERQWLLDALDTEKNEMRAFAMKDIRGWRPYLETDEQERTGA